MAPPPDAFIDSFRTATSQLVGIVDIANASGINHYLGFRDADRYFLEVAQSADALAGAYDAVSWRVSGDQWALAGPFPPAALHDLAESLTRTYVVDAPWKRSVVADGLVKRVTGTQRTRITCSVRACFGTITASPDAAADALAALVPRASFGPVGRAVNVADVPHARPRWSCAEPLEPIPFACPFCARSEPQTPAFSYPDRCDGCGARIILT